MRIKVKERAEKKNSLYKRKHKNRRQINPNAHHS